MLYKTKVAAIAAAAALSLTACDFSATGSVECSTNDAGEYVCTGQSTAIPDETTTPAPDPGDGDDGGGETPPPDDGGEVAPAADVNTGAMDGKVRVFWTTERTDITGWYVERDGTDTTGTGPWGTELPVETTDVTFDLLENGTEYNFTLTARTANGDLEPITVSATPVGSDNGGGETPPPAGGPGDTAADALGWGTPIAAASDEFNYTGAPDPAKWGVYNGEGHDGNGRRVGENNRVNGSALVQTGEANGDSAGLASSFNQRYGRWEARVRTEALGADNGRQYHPLLIIWPESNLWPDHGEYDFFENPAPGLDRVEAFLHYPGHTPIRQEHSVRNGVDTTQWQNIAFEWTPDHLKGFINGQEWFSHSKHDITGMPSGHLTIQLDNFYGGNMQPAKYEVDWVRTYTLD